MKRVHILETNKGFEYQLIRLTFKLPPQPCEPYQAGTDKEHGGWFGDGVYRISLYRKIDGFAVYNSAVQGQIFTTEKGILIDVTLLIKAEVRIVGGQYSVIRPIPI